MIDDALRKNEKRLRELDKKLATAQEALDAATEALKRRYFTACRTAGFRGSLEEYKAAFMKNRR